MIQSNKHPSAKPMDASRFFGGINNGRKNRIMLSLFFPECDCAGKPWLDCCSGCQICFVADTLVFFHDVRHTCTQR